ncbi:hypothetical protein C9374_006588 [Naegleria lovaniensis]|uniref:Uncharacterized protein n=1 Tax=Naegleria lovaniensis TaxID=51637 RepID=A0AA88GLS0_NAELO|nr:uncharacterized protein C9374_006588 [Naegleria lovaniensis]KAG2379471.1 hypothetical protein C9374_006588 [Naegleria lovaniensis]
MVFDFDKALNDFKNYEQELIEKNCSNLSFPNMENNVNHITIPFQTTRSQENSSNLDALERQTRKLRSSIERFYSFTHGPKTQSTMMLKDDDDYDLQINPFITRLTFTLACSNDVVILSALCEKFPKLEELTLVCFWIPCFELLLNNDVTTHFDLWIFTSLQELKEISLELPVTYEGELVEHDDDILKEVETFTHYLHFYTLNHYERLESVLKRYYLCVSPPCDLEELDRHSIWMLRCIMRSSVFTLPQKKQLLDRYFPLYWYPLLSHVYFPLEEILTSSVNQSLVQYMIYLMNKYELPLRFEATRATMKDFWSWCCLSYGMNMFPHLKHLLTFSVIEQQFKKAIIQHMKKKIKDSTEFGMTLREFQIILEKQQDFTTMVYLLDFAHECNMESLNSEHIFESFRVDTSHDRMDKKCQPKKNLFHMLVSRIPNQNSLILENILERHVTSDNLLELTHTHDDEYTFSALHLAILYQYDSSLILKMVQKQPLLLQIKDHDHRNDLHYGCMFLQYYHLVTQFLEMNPQLRVEKDRYERTPYETLKYFHALDDLFIPPSLKPSINP